MKPVIFTYSQSYSLSRAKRKLLLATKAFKYSIWKTAVSNEQPKQLYEAVHSCPGADNSSLTTLLQCTHGYYTHI